MRSLMFKSSYQKNDKLLTIDFTFTHIENILIKIKNFGAVNVFISTDKTHYD